MSNLLTKSKENRRAVEVLNEADCFAPMAHCSYYHCFQYMKHLLLYKLEYTSDDIANAANEIKGGSHKLITGLIRRELRKKDYALITDFVHIYNVLLEFREHSDYEDVVIDKRKAKDATDRSDELKTFLDKYL